MVYAPKIKKFRFENVWIKEEQCFNVVKDSWLQSDGIKIIEKVNYCCLKLDE